MYQRMAARRVYWSATAGMRLWRRARTARPAVRCAWRNGIGLRAGRRTSYIQHTVAAIRPLYTSIAVPWRRVSRSRSPRAACCPAAGSRGPGAPARYRSHPAPGSRLTATSPRPLHNVYKQPMPAGFTRSLLLPVTRQLLLANAARRAHGARGTNVCMLQVALDYGDLP